MKPSPQRATLERQGKRKAEADGNRNKTSGGRGKTEAPETNLTRRKPTTTSSTQRAKPTWREENARTHEIGPMGKLVYDKMYPQRMQNS